MSVDTQPAQPAGKADGASETRLYVGGLPEAVTLAELTERFTPFGAVTNAQLVPPRGTALPRPPLAFVTLVATPPRLQRCLKTVRTRIAPATMRAHPRCVAPLCLVQDPAVHVLWPVEI